MGNAVGFDPQKRNRGMPARIHSSRICRHWKRLPFGLVSAVCSTEVDSTPVIRPTNCTGERKVTDKGLPARRFRACDLTRPQDEMPATCRPKSRALEYCQNRCVLFFMIWLRPVGLVTPLLAYYKVVAGVCVWMHTGCIWLRI